MITLLARGVVRRRWIVLGGWIALGVFAVVRARGVEDRLDLRGGSPNPTEATRVADLLRTRFSQDLGETFLVVLSGPAPFNVGRPQQVLDTLVAALGREPYVREIVSYSSPDDSALISKDRRTTVALVILRVSDADSVLKLVAPVRAVVHGTLAALLDGAQYRALVTGDTPLERDMLTVTTQDVVHSERRLVPLTGAILVLAFGSLVAALVPLAIGFLAITIALAIVSALATVTAISIYVLNMATMIGLGVGIDYSLLVVTRFREELARGLPREDAVVRALVTAGATVVASGLTVALGFAGLLFTPLIETRSIGLGGLVVVAVAVVLSVTLLPALLAILGTRLGRPHRLLDWYRAPRVWERWARFLSRHPVPALVVGGLAMACLAAPARGIKIGLPARHWWPPETEAGEGVDLLVRTGGAGYVQPVPVLVEFPEGRRAVDAGSLRGLRALSESLRADPRVREVRSLVDLRPRTSLLQYALLYSDVSAARAQYPVLMDEFLSTDARLARLDVVLADTASPTSAMDVVRRARRLASQELPALRGARILVGGYAAQNLDVQDDLLRRFPVLVSLIFAATAVMLGAVFRSVLIPVKAIVLNALSVLATFGLIVLVFQRGVGARLFGLEGPTSAIFVAVPVLVFAVVFGLSMDYEVFLLGRIKEALDRSRSNDGATVEGLAATASVVTSAALIMITVFGVFAFARVLVIQVLGFGLAVAVLLDATIIRMVLVPAFMHLAGRWNWWPGVRAGTP